MSIPSNAIDLLEADHRQVEIWFEEFEESDDGSEKQDLATRICKALTIHMQIEEEIFYPAFLESVDDIDLHHEALVEHEIAKELIAKIEEAKSSDDEYFDARVRVLSEMMKHHINEEEQADGLFDEADASDMDLEELGAQMQQRKLELTDDEDAAVI